MTTRNTLGVLGSLIVSMLLGASAVATVTQSIQEHRFTYFLAAGTTPLVILCIYSLGVSIGLAVKSEKS